VRAWGGKTYDAFSGSSFPRKWKKRFRTALQSKRRVKKYRRNQETTPIHNKYYSIQIQEPPWGTFLTEGAPTAGISVFGEVFTTFLDKNGCPGCAFL